MNIRLHQFTQRLINHPVAFQQWLTSKCTGADCYDEVTTAILRTGMPGVQMTFIFDA